MVIKISKQNILLDSIPSWFNDYYWHVSNGYLRGNDKKTNEPVSFSRLIMGAKNGDGKIVDHINRIRTDNRLSNLRFVTRAENNINRRMRNGAYRGVYYHKLRKVWYVQVFINRKYHTPGRIFKSREEARVAAENLRKKIHGSLYTPES